MVGRRRPRRPQRKGNQLSDDLVERLLDWPYQGETMAHEAADRIKALTAEVAELQQVFDLHWRAQQRGVDNWRKETPGNDLVLPDSAELIFWMLERIDALTAERDKAYANGYSDAETEISKSALGQRNAFLHSQYANAAARIKDLNELLEEAQTEWSNYSSAWMTAEGKLADAEDFIEHLLTLLTEAASDLTTYVDAEYPPDTCDRYPDIARRHFRDMELVRRIKSALTGKEPSHE